MKRKSRIKLFSLASIVAAATSLSSCASQSIAPVPAAAVGQQQMAALPAGFQQALAQAPEEQQQAFFVKTAEERQAIVDEWQRRESMMDRFSPVEQMIISTLSQDDSDAFFALPDDQKKEQEFLARAETGYLDSLDTCLVETHRRFGPAEANQIAPGVMTQFAPAEQSVIKHLTAQESAEFLALSKDQREQFLNDAVTRKVDQLLECATRSNRRPGDPT